MKRKLLTGGLAAFFILMIAATVIAENIYYDSLPVVEVGYVTEGPLTRQFELTGHIRYEMKENTYQVPINCSGVSFLAGDDAEVKRGKPVYRVPVDEVLRLQKQVELALYSLEEENRKISPDGNVSGLSEESRLRYGINAIDIDAQRKRLTQLESLARSEGVVFANQDGRIHYAVEEGLPVGEGQTVAIIEEDTGGRVLDWGMAASDGALFGIGDSVELVVNVLEQMDKETTGTEQSLQTLQITDIAFSPESQTYLFKARFSDEVTLGMEDGVAVTLTCKYESSEVYPFVIPTEAVTFSSDSTGTVYILQSRKRVYGEEYYVVASSAIIQRSVGRDTALENAFANTEYVIASDRELHDGMVVRLK